MIVLPPMPPEQTASWIGILDLHERLAEGPDEDLVALQRVEGLVASYHDEAAEGGRRHRLVVGLHPSITHSTKEH